MFHHPDHSWMIANVDRVIVGSNRGLECKTVSAFKADEWRDDEVTDAYYLQCQHYMAVMGWDSCFIAALIGGQRFVFKEILRNDEEIRSLVEAEKRFWEDHVLTGVPPLIGFGDDPAVLYPSQAADVLLAPTEEDLEQARRLASLRAAIDDLTRERDKVEVRLKARIGECEGIEGVATWKQTASKTSVDWEALALSLDPTREQVEAHTVLKAGTRRFLFKYKPGGASVSQKEAA